MASFSDAESRNFWCFRASSVGSYSGMLTKKLLNQIFDHIDQKHSELQERVIKHTFLKDIVIQSARYVFVTILQCVERWC